MFIVIPECESLPSEAEEVGEEQEEEKVYEERERRFDPAADPELHNIPHQSLIQFDPETQWSNLARKCSETGELKVDPTTLVINLANRHRRILGFDQFITSWALYFGPQSRYNKSHAFDWEDFISEEKADYINLEEALEHIYDSLSDTITQVIIATDSPSLVKLVTEDLTKLARDNDFWRYKLYLLISREGGQEGGGEAGSEGGLITSTYNYTTPRTNLSSQAYPPVSCTSQSQYHIREIPLAN
ncbi:hypothetical protein FNAPI_2793 [Fusarium napiforme]|uniref:Uncharacterized protein n=1 Tax=Fusarium napiforme TaxID=42672 RepID=A0A8H5K011_9HYPO|nr:hypothetical protein FNAPI_2793 [Fusarium napiforme]